VVAAEVRTLAQRAASAAKEIKTLTGDSVERIEAGTRLVGEAASTMQEVVDSIRRVTACMGEISVSSEAQSAGIEQVNGAIADLDQVTQQNAALVQETAAAAQSLQEQAGELVKLVHVFRLDAGGVKTALAALPGARNGGCRSAGLITITAGE
jgi:methyl-accepting chemotaxis protein